MAEFNRTALDMMDELYAPYKAAAAQGRQLQRSSAGLELQRRTQVADTEAKWGHEKAGTMAKWVNDADVARQTQSDRQSNITLELEERQRIQDESKKAERERMRQEKEDDFARMWHETRNSTKEIVDGREHVRYEVKEGFLDDGILEGDWAGATGSTLTRWGASLLEQKNTVKVMNLERNSIIEKIHALARTPAQQIMVEEILDGVKLSDLRNPEWSQQELAELYGDIATMNYIVENPQVLSEHGKLIRRRARLFNQTPLEEILKDQNNASVSALASGLASSQNLRMRLLSDDEGDLGQTEVDRIMAMLGSPENPAQGLQDAMNYVADRDEAGMVFNDEMMKWAEKNASGLATGIMARMQDYKLQMEEIQRINETVKSNLDIYPWLKAVPSTHFYNEEITSEMAAVPRSTTEGDAEAAPNEDIESLASQGGPVGSPEERLSSATAAASAVGQGMEAEVGYTPAQVAAAEEELRTPRFEGDSAAWSKQWGGSASNPGGLVGLGHIFGGKSAPISTNMFGTETSNVTDEAGATVPAAEARLLAVRNRQIAEMQSKGWSRNYGGKIETHPTKSKSRRVADVKAAHLAFDELDAIDEKLKVIAGPEKWKWLQGSFGAGSQIRRSPNLSRGYNKPTPLTEYSLDNFYNK
jgi:hypothetical protein